MTPASVAVWWMSLELERGPARTVMAALPDTERARAARMPSRLRAREFIAARWLLRHALSHRLGAAAWSCALAPESASPDPDTRWSLAHDDGVAAVAVAHGAAVGIDVVRRLPAMVRPEAIGAVLNRSAAGARPGDDAVLHWMRAEAEVKLAGGWRAARQRHGSGVHTILQGPCDARAVIVTTRSATIVQRQVAYP